MKASSSAVEGFIEAGIMSVPPFELSATDITGAR
jgi:hypothetical protein